MYKVSQPASCLLPPSDDNPNFPRPLVTFNCHPSPSRRVFPPTTGVPISQSSSVLITRNTLHIHISIHRTTPHPVPSPENLTPAATSGSCRSQKNQSASHFTRDIGHGTHLPRLSFQSPPFSPGADELLHDTRLQLLEVCDSFSLPPPEIPEVGTARLNPASLPACARPRKSHGRIGSWTCIMRSHARPNPPQH